MSTLKIQLLRSNGNSYFVLATITAKKKEFQRSKKFPQKGKTAQKSLMIYGQNTKNLFKSHSPPEMFV